MNAVFSFFILHAGFALGAGFCRYDAASVGEPVLSTTANHPVISFHRPHEWTLVTLVE